ncbi:MAG: DegT/DnrJ/EryC1/StrS family aminotransferase [Chloroflexota bacterium]
MQLTPTGLSETPSNFRLAEQGLLEQMQGNAIFWSGRAATSLYHAYLLAKENRPNVAHPEIIMPAMMCTTSAHVAHLAGITPRFADVHSETGLVDLETIKARYTSNTVAVVVIHLLGHLVDIDSIADWCRANDILLIEDPTQALGAQFSDGRYAGSVGDVSVYSFNRTKIIHVGNGVLVSRKPDLTETLCKIAETPFKYPQLDDNTRLQLSLSARNLHHALVGLLRVNARTPQQVSEAFLHLRQAFEPLYIRSTNPDVDLNSAWNNLPHALSHRLKLANIYADRLGHHSAWQVLTDFQQSGVCWRFSLLINNPEQQITFSEAIRRDGFHVSNLYWSPNQFFKPSDTCDGADAFSRRIVNLWVDESVDEDYVQKCCDSLLKHVDMLR